MLLHGAAWLLLLAVVHLAFCAEDFYKVRLPEIWQPIFRY
jgi:hypothetical protein